MPEPKKPEPPQQDVQEKIDPDYSEDDFDRALRKVSKRVKPVPGSPKTGDERRPGGSI
jgi:hypothetical protein